ncbi:hypothetical protein GGI43DRAFT_413348 [Trichoderma evansii]
MRIWSVDTGECKRVINLGYPARNLYFGADDASLITSAGVIPLFDETIPSLPYSPVLSTRLLSNISINERASWITWYDHDILWLPTECRWGEVAVSGPDVVIGCRSGRMVLLQFSKAKLERLL